MSGLIDDLFSPPSQQSAAPPLLGPIIGGDGDDASTTPNTRLQPLPTGTPSAASPSSPAPVRTGEADAGDDDNNETEQSTTQPALPSTTPTRPRPTFIITDSPSDALTTSALPPPLSPSAVPSLPATPDPDDVLIVAPSPTVPLVLPTGLLAAPTTLLTLTSSTLDLPSGTPLSGDAEASLADPSASNGAMASLMPALPISLGVGGGVLFFGVIAGLLYKKGVWPFRGEREREGRFEELEDGGNAATAEMKFQRKWDPRVSGVGVFTTRTNGATNF